MNKCDVVAVDGTRKLASTIAFVPEALHRRAETADITATYPERPTRFAFGNPERFFSGYGVAIHAAEGKED